MNVKKIALIFLMSWGLFSCAETNPPVFSILAEPGFDGYYIQTKDNTFLPLAEVKRSSFQENISVHGHQYPFCEIYTLDNFKKVTQIKLEDYRVIAVRGDLGRSVANDYKLYQLDKTISADHQTVKLCAREMGSQLAKHGATVKIKPLVSVGKGLYYIKDKTWFINSKSRLFILK